MQSRLFFLLASLSEAVLPLVRNLVLAGRAVIALLQDGNRRFDHLHALPLLTRRPGFEGLDGADPGEAGPGPGRAGRTPWKSSARPRR